MVKNIFYLVGASKQNAFFFKNFTLKNCPHAPSVWNKRCLWSFHDFFMFEIQLKSYINSKQKFYKMMEIDVYS